MKQWLQGIDALTGLAKNGNTIIGGLADKASAFQRLLDLSKVESEIRIKAAFVDLQKQILDAQSANVELQISLNDHKQMLMELDAKLEKFDRYARCETKTGHFVYRSKKDCPEAEPPHYVCPVCYDDGHISMLQGDQLRKECRRNKTHGWFSVEAESPEELAKREQR